LLPYGELLLCAVGLDAKVVEAECHTVVAESLKGHHDFNILEGHGVHEVIDLGSDAPQLTHTSRSAIDVRDEGLDIAVDEPGLPDVVRCKVDIPYQV
jgi:hypothetical protein